MDGMPSMSLADRRSPGCTRPIQARRCSTSNSAFRSAMPSPWLVGGQNVLGTYPDVNMFGTDTVGNQYGQFSPFGFNGAYYYTRLNYRWGGM